MEVKDDKLLVFPIKSGKESRKVKRNLCKTSISNSNLSSIKLFDFEVFIIDLLGTLGRWKEGKICILANAKKLIKNLKKEVR